MIKAEVVFDVDSISIGDFVVAINWELFNFDVYRNNEIVNTQSSLEDAVIYCLENKDE